VNCQPLTAVVAVVTGRQEQHQWDLWDQWLTFGVLGRGMFKVWEGDGHPSHHSEVSKSFDIAGTPHVTEWIADCLANT